MAERDMKRIHELEGMLLDDNSPLVKHLEQYMAPYNGKVPQELYKQIGQEEAHRWVKDTMFGGALPSDEEMNALAGAMDTTAANGLGVPPGQAGTTPTLERQRQALATIRNFAPKVPAVEMSEEVITPTPSKSALLGGTKGSYAPMVGQDGSDDAKLAEAQILIMQQLAQPEMVWNNYGDSKRIKESPRQGK